MLELNKLSKIGIGTWGLGGYADYDVNVDIDRQIEMVSYTINQGINWAEANMWSANGKSVEILAKGIENSKIERSNFCLVQVIYSHDGSTIEVAESKVNEFMELNQTDYIDILSFDAKFIHELGIEKIIKYQQKLIEQKQLRFVGVTNSNLENLKRYHIEFGEKLVTNEVGFNFEVRDLEDIGIIPFARENDIKSIVFQPLRRNRTAKINWPLLTQLAKKYDVTQNQVILAWMITKGIYPIIKSTTKSHIDENIAAQNLNLAKVDIELVDKFRAPNYQSPKVDWDYSGEGVIVHQLSNVFDERYKT